MPGAASRPRFAPASGPAVRCAGTSFATSCGTFRQKATFGSRPARRSPTISRRWNGNAAHKNRQGRFQILPRIAGEQLPPFLGTAAFDESWCATQVEESCRRGCRPASRCPRRRGPSKTEIVCLDITGGWNRAPSLPPHRRHSGDLGDDIGAAGDLGHMIAPGMLRVTLYVGNAAMVENELYVGREVDECHGFESDAAGRRDRR